jgi:hypothetical protein
VEEYEPYNSCNATKSPEPKYDPNRNLTARLEMQVPYNWNREQQDNNVQGEGSASLSKAKSDYIKAKTALTCPGSGYRVALEDDQLNDVMSALWSPIDLSYLGLTTSKMIAHMVIATIADQAAFENRGIGKTRL